jgi:hypothetical protein
LRSPAWAWLALLAAGPGCAMPNLYTTPRATPRGKATGTLAPQLVDQPELRNEAYAMQLGVRLGLAPRLDAGLRTNFAAIGGDVKWNAVRSRDFDFALDGGVEILPDTLYVDMPLLFGINLGEAITLLPSTGITLGLGNQPTMNGRDTYDDGVLLRRPAGRVLIRGGLGAQLRLTPRFAVVPEFTYTGPVDGGIHGTSEYLAFGLGFCFGPQPY